MRQVAIRVFAQALGAQSFGIVIRANGSLCSGLLSLQVGAYDDEEYPEGKRQIRPSQGGYRAHT